MENNGIIQIGQSTVIINGGNPLPGCPIDWDEAKKWQDKANEGKEDCPQWGWDCGFKLDYDGPILHISSRFYPPKTHYGATWDGTVTLYCFDRAIKEKKFDCPTLDELKTQVETYVNQLKDEFVTPEH